VVPILTDSTWFPGSFAFRNTSSMATSTPPWISGVVGVLCHSRTLSPSIITAVTPPSIPQSHDEGGADLPSVFVPPTSIPMTQDRLEEVVAAITGDIERETRIRANFISGGTMGVLLY
jgi:hypothetical protein